jgi:hypothetical protein
MKMQFALTTLLSDNYLKSELIAKGFEQAKKFSWQEAIKKKIDIIQNRSPDAH